MNNNEIFTIFWRNCIVPRANWRVILSAEYNRKCLPTQHENNIHVTWAERITHNPSLWNGSKFRLASVSVEDDIVTMHLGITCYRDYLGTNWSADAAALAELGKYGSHRGPDLKKNAILLSKT